MNRADRRRLRVEQVPGPGNAPKPNVALAYVHPGVVQASFMFCTARTMVYEIGRVGAPPILLAQQCASGQLVEARNDVVRDFLTTDCDWLFFVDSDMGFDADCLHGLLDSADPVNRPMVGALCFGLRKRAVDEHLQARYLDCYPTVYVWRERELDDGKQEVGFQVVKDYPRDSLVEVSGTGAACFVAHRSLLERIRDQYGPVWFDQVRHPTGRIFSEDLSFCIRVAGVGSPIYVNTAVKTSHDKGGICLTEQSWDDQEIVRRAREVDA